MSALSFAYALLLHGEARRSELLGMLPEQRRAEVEASLERIGGSAPELVRSQLRMHRESQCSAQRQAAEARIGIPLEKMSRKVSAWLARPF